jgi:hypothetical protein
MGPFRVYGALYNNIKELRDTVDLTGWDNNKITDDVQEQDTDEELGLAKGKFKGKWKTKN